MVLGHLAAALGLAAALAGLGAADLASWGGCDASGSCSSAGQDAVEEDEDQAMLQVGQPMQRLGQGVPGGSDHTTGNDEEQSFLQVELMVQRHPRTDGVAFPANLHVAKEAAKAIGSVPAAMQHQQLQSPVEQERQPQATLPEQQGHLGPDAQPLRLQPLQGSSTGHMDLSESRTGSRTGNRAGDASGWNGFKMVLLSYGFVALQCLAHVCILLYLCQQGRAWWAAKLAAADSKRSGEEPAECVAGAVPEPLLQVSPRLTGTAPRLSHVGTSFVVPWSRTHRSKSSSLSVGVAVVPAVWPLRASFSRPATEAVWSKIELTVDVIDAAGLPPLLFCTRFGASPRPSTACTGGTGATGDAPSGGAADLEQLVRTASERRSPWLEVRGGSGSLAAVVVKESVGRCTIQRPGHASLEVEMHLEGTERWIAIRRRGQDVGLATRLSGDKLALLSAGGEVGEAMPSTEEEESVQIDTQPDTSSPESVLLLLCMLAMLVFPPP